MILSFTKIYILTSLPRNLIELIRFLHMLNVLAVSATTTSPELSSHTYKHLYRTVPSDAFRAKAVADIIEHFNWSYVAAVAIDDSYGRNGVWSVIKEAEKKRSYRLDYCNIRTLTGRYFDHHNDFFITSTGSASN